jgi:hypothetical protein
MPSSSFSVPSSVSWAAVVATSLVLGVTAGGCSKEEIAVRTDRSNDYNQGALSAAVNRFVADGRTPEAYAQFARTVFELRPGMDRAVAEVAELKLIVLALAPVQSVQARPMKEQIDALALTVWPALLSPKVASDDVLTKRDPRAAKLMPTANENVTEYLQRLCGGTLASDCKQVVPEHQGEVVLALATRRAMERARNAVADCMTCDTEPGWRDAVRSWEKLDRQAHAWIDEVERRGAPDNWPVAGAASEPAGDLPEAEISVNGEVVIGGQRYTASDRVDALRELRGKHSDIALNIRPEVSLAQLRGVVADAARAGANKVAVIARAPAYPWDRKMYWIGAEGSTRAGLRPTDSLQSLLHAVDHLAGPGAIARVD